ncbi:Type I site-specific deoxyribonuclease, HsdR family [Mesomycoplasma hyorhinis HUB-1]|uniref:type I restriction enzyme subunit R domain-containing protein n=1 Tax=Mesomycoplasma hyorhinis TaxID=2100 RepID=UPI0001E13345|nr:Type I site-specific deoxyribonuclease, HsdR family [Mesomycoplasma hyorhinis HUB-1]
MSNNNVQNCKTFNSETEFQQELFHQLTTKYGWKYPSENDEKKWNVTHNAQVNKTLNGYKIENHEYWSEKKLRDNWKKIIEFNNQDRLEGVPLTPDELERILKYLNSNDDPAKNTIGKRNELLLQGVVEIERDNGQKVILNIFPSNSTYSNQTIIYQVVREVTASKLIPIVDNKSEKVIFDFVFLINGIPVVLLETKLYRPIEAAKQQVQNYHKFGLFNTGFFSLIQMFAVMRENVFFYTTNKNDSDKLWFEDFIFNWTDENNKKASSWCYIADTFLRASVLHNLIGLYSTADKEDIKILRPYQYWAIKSIKNRLLGWDPYNNKYIDNIYNTTNIWDNYKIGKNGEKLNESIKLGYIWHSTGAGKTLTSFKLAQLLLKERIGNKILFDKVIFLVDRKDLSLQTEEAYKSFNANLETKKNNIKKAKNIHELEKYILDNENKFIIGSHQKLSEVCKALSSKKKEQINKKRIALIFDEAHRSTSAEMFKNIKKTFINGCLIGFTGTPKLNSSDSDEDDANEIYTEDAFGPRLHTYTMGNAIIDKKVLKFNLTYPNLFEFNVWVYAKNTGILDTLSLKTQDFTKDNLDLVKKYLEEKHIDDLTWIRGLRILDKSKKDETIKKYNSFLLINNNNSNNKSDEELKDENWLVQIRREIIVDDIIKNWDQNNYPKKSLFSSILATNKIVDAIEYFKTFQKFIKNNKSIMENFKFTAIFDSTDSNEEEYEYLVYKKRNIEEIKQQYFNDFGKEFIETSAFKEDVIKRLLKKEPKYNNEKQHLHLVIVVDQLLTGFDSKYIKTIYIDKSLEDARLIQAMSRTNRIFKSKNKNEGNVVFYINPPQMFKNVHNALEKYAQTKYDQIIENPNQEPRILLVTNLLISNIDKIKKIVPNQAEYNELQTLSYIEDEKVNEKVSKYIRTFVKIYDLWNLKDFLKDKDYKGEKAELYFNKHIKLTEEEFQIFKSLFKQLYALYDTTKTKNLNFSFPVIDEDHIKVTQIMSSYTEVFGEFEVKKMSEELSIINKQLLEEKEKKNSIADNIQTIKENKIKEELNNIIKNNSPDQLIHRWAMWALKENEFKSIFSSFLYNDNEVNSNDIQNVIRKSINDWRIKECEKIWEIWGVKDKQLFWDTIKGTDQIDKIWTEKKMKQLGNSIDQDKFLKYLIRENKIKESSQVLPINIYMNLKKELQNLKLLYNY